MPSFFIMYYSFWFLFFGIGTGSNPPFENGLHLRILQNVSLDALKKLWTSYASLAYLEHDG